MSVAADALRLAEFPTQRWELLAEESRAGLADATSSTQRRDISSNLSKEILENHLVTIRHYDGRAGINLHKIAHAIFLAELENAEAVILGAARPLEPLF